MQLSRQMNAVSSQQALDSKQDLCKNFRIQWQSAGSLIKQSEQDPKYKAMKVQAFAAEGYTAYKFWSNSFSTLWNVAVCLEEV